MPRRALAAAAAGVLALAGGALVTSYVSSADARAMAGLETVDVLVVTEPIPTGATAAEVADRVAPKTLPATAVVDGALTTLDPVKGQVATADLLPGEQLVAARFTDPEALRTGAVEIPDGAHQVTLPLDAARIVGGSVEAGSRVGVFVSMTDPQQTHLTLNSVLVSRVQGAIPGDEGDESGSATPEGTVLVTLVLTAPQAEEVVFAAEHGSIWLSLDADGASAAGTKIVSKENVFQ
jgi:pilus assembly protein CpaB